MFEPKKNHPRWVLAFYPYWVFLQRDRKTLFRAITGRQRFWWHYSWESEELESKSVDHPDFRYHLRQYPTYRATERFQYH